MTTHHPNGCWNCLHYDICPTATDYTYDNNEQETCNLHHTDPDIDAQDPDDY